MEAVNKQYGVSVYRYGNQIYSFAVINYDHPDDIVRFSNKTLNSFILKQKPKILDLVYSKSFVQLRKSDLAKTLIYEAKNHIYPQIKKQIYQKPLKSKLSKENSQSIDVLFQNLKLKIVTPFFWQRCFWLVRQPQFFQVIGRIERNKIYKYYIIKYKYFDNIQNITFAVKLNFDQHSAYKLLKNFDQQHKISENSKFVINEKYIHFQNQIIEMFQKYQNNIKYKIIGLFIIERKYFYLKKFSTLSLSNSEWFPSFRNSQGRQKYNLNTQEIINSYKHSLSNQPYFYTQSIEQILKQQENDSNDQILQQKVQKYLYLFQQKLKRLKIQIKRYNEGVQVFNSYSQSITINQLRQKIEQSINRINNETTDQVLHKNQMLEQFSQEQYSDDDKQIVIDEQKPDEEQSIYDSQDDDDEQQSDEQTNKNKNHKQQPFLETRSQNTQFSQNFRRISSSSVDQKYRLYSYKNLQHIVSFLILKSGSNDFVRVSIRTVKAFFQKLKLKTLDLVHQNISVELRKQEIIEKLIQQIKNHIYPWNQKLFHKKRSEKLSHKQNKQDLNVILKNFKLNIVTPLFLQRCYNSIKSSELFQVIGKIKKYYIIKYKHFHNLQNIIFVTKSNFVYGQITKKRLLQRFDVEHKMPVQSKFIIDEKYLHLQKQILQLFKKYKNTVKYQLIGALKIKNKMYFLKKFKSFKLMESQWYRKNYKDSKIELMQNTRKILKRLNQNSKNQPQFDIQTITKILKKQQLIQIQVNKQEKNNLTLEQKVRYVLQLFRSKLKRLKFEIKRYSEGVPIFNRDSQSITIDQLRQKIKQFNRTNNEFTDKGLQKLQKPYKQNFKQQQMTKHQFIDNENDEQQQQESIYDSQQQQDISSQQQQTNQKYQQQQCSQSQQHTKQVSKLIKKTKESQLKSQQSSLFYKKIKQECKKQEYYQQRSWYFQGQDNYKKEEQSLDNNDDQNEEILLKYQQTQQQQIEHNIKKQEIKIQAIQQQQDNNNNDNNSAQIILSSQQQQQESIIKKQDISTSTSTDEKYFQLID